MICGPDLSQHTSTVTSANIYMGLGIDNSWSQEQFEEDFSIHINSIDEHDIEFDMRHVDPSIANAVRRILISEVPTMAIEHVFFVNNTSIITEEVLAHRLGLVPIKVDPALFEDKTNECSPNERNTVVLKLKVDCKRQGEEIINEKVYSGQLQWLPEGSEMPEETTCRFARSQAGAIPGGVDLVHDNILLAKMRPGQSIELEAHCIKGVGSEHAKWSPVGTAWYRLHPELEVLQAITGLMADEIVALCPGLFVMEGSGEQRQAKVTSARGNEMQLEKVRRLLSEEEWAKYLQLRKRKEHFIFTIQSTGALAPETLFMRAVDKLADKCDTLLGRL
ncbi:hypothetical protein WJX72_007346 [[Myrmecia] bisecta]|uniref:Plastid-encoded RNA polymerase subunit alpha n=1 Tax=[Myrmecia] bisecta TaxID=41462 RepID=A0AAW1QRF4_9CHLO